MAEPDLGRVRVAVRRHLLVDDFVAGFESDGVVQRTAPILKDLVGMTDAEAHEYIWSQGWKASIVDDEPKIIQHEESFEVQRDGKRHFFYFDENAGRRAISGRMSKDKALRAAQAFLRGNQPKISAALPAP